MPEYLYGKHVLWWWLAFVCVVPAIPALFGKKKIQNQGVEEGSAVTFHAELSKHNAPVRW